MAEFILFERRKEDGFTLVELLWASAITLVVLAALFAALSTGLSGSSMLGSKVQATDEGMTSMRLMERYIRQAAILSICEENRIKFSINTGSEGSYNYEDVTFQILGTNLQFVRDSTSKVICRNVRNGTLGIPLFRYFDNQGEEILDPTLVKSKTTLIRITLIIDNNISEPPSPLYIGTDINLRNFNI